MSLDLLKKNQKAIIMGFNLTDKNLLKRLYDIGIVKGTVVKCIAVSPLGDPKAYEIRGAVIALRVRDADNIYGIIDRADKTPEVLL